MHLPGNYTTFFTIPETPLRIYHYQRVDSTNIRAEALARVGEPAWTVVWSDEQTAGRGRFQREWISPAGLGLWFSLILRPHLPLGKWNLINLFSALTVAEVLDEKFRLVGSGKTVRVKWPNDVYVGERKICGILLQSGRDAGGENFLIVGIGINVNQGQEHFPGELQDRATSLFRETGMYWELIPLLKEILEQFYREYGLEEERQFANLVARFEQKMVFRGEEVKIKLPDKVIEGKIVKLTEDGFLILQTDRGEQLITAGDVGILKEKGV